MPSRRCVRAGRRDGTSPRSAPGIAAAVLRGAALVARSAPQGVASQLPFFTLRLDFNVDTIRAHHDSADLVGTQHVYSKSRESVQHIVAGMPIHVACSHRNDSKVRPDGGEESIAAAGRASVVANLQDIGAQPLP